MNDNNLHSQLSFIEKNCESCNGTDFTKPLGEVLRFIKSVDVRELYVLFLTDGMDNERAKTIEMSETLKSELHSKSIYSWFNVIGLG